MKRRNFIQGSVAAIAAAGFGKVAFGSNTLAAANVSASNGAIFDN